eukprot:m.43207 g.43207  ORF g.43207 m.43207 type:complete len:388 (-) comp8402_c0_seq1:2384-3547(-)
MDLKVAAPQSAAARRSGQDEAYTDGESLFLATLGMGWLSSIAIGAVALSQPDRRSQEAAAQYSQIVFWNVLLLVLADARILNSRFARWALSCGLILASLRCRHPIVRGLYFWVSLHVVVLKVPRLAQAKTLLRFPSKVSRVAYCSWFLDLDDAVDLDNMPDPDEVFKQEGGRRVKWMAHTLFQGLTASFTVFLIAMCFRRGYIDVVNDVTDMQIAISAAVGAVIVYCTLQTVDACYRFAMLLPPSNPRLPAPMMVAPWRASSASNFWGDRWSVTTTRQQKAAMYKPMIEHGFSRVLGNCAMFLFSTVAWGGSIVAADFPIESLTYLALFLLAHMVVVLVEEASGISGGAAVFWSWVALTAHIFGYACMPVIGGLQNMTQTRNSGVKL